MESQRGRRNIKTKKKLLARIEEHCSFETACQGLGITHKTLFNLANLYEAGTLSIKKLKWISETLGVEFDELKNYDQPVLKEKVAALLGTLFSVAAQDIDSVVQLKQLAVKYEQYELAMILKRVETALQRDTPSDSPAGV